MDQTQTVHKQTLATANYGNEQGNEVNLGCGIMGGFEHALSRTVWKMGATALVVTKYTNILLSR